jgi:hypothetical protein
MSTKPNTLDKVGSFCVGKINYARNGGGNAFMRKYLYNNHHIEVNLESRNDIVWSSHYDLGKHAVYLATDEISYDEVDDVHAPFQ